MLSTCGDTGSFFLTMINRWEKQQFPKRLFYTLIYRIRCNKRYQQLGFVQFWHFLERDCFLAYLCNRKQVATVFA